MNFGLHTFDFKQFTKLLGFSQDLINQFEVLFAEPIEVESFMLPTVDLALGEPRNLKVTNPIGFPEGFQVNASVGSGDVIHNGSIEFFNVKVDCVPGRINTAQFDVPRAGTYYGQCSELCGINHGFMPIEVKVVPIEKYIKGLEKIVDLRSKQNGLEGLKAYLAGQHGQDDLTLRDPNATFEQKSHAKMIKHQAEILHRYRLKIEFFNGLGFKLSKDTSHLALKNEYMIVNENGESAGVDQGTHVEGAHEAYLQTFPKKHPGLIPKYHQESGRNRLYHYAPRLSYHNRTYPPHLFQQLKPNVTEPNYLHHEYLVKMPDSLKFESTRRMMFGMKAAVRLVLKFLAHA